MVLDVISNAIRPLLIRTPLYVIIEELDSTVSVNGFLVEVRYVFLLLEEEEEETWSLNLNSGD